MTLETQEIGFKSLTPIRLKAQLSSLSSLGRTGLKTQWTWAQINL